MPKSISHEEIAERLVQAKVVDFAAMGKFIADLGPVLAVSDQGWHGVNFGRWNILACCIPPADAARLVGNLRVAGLTTAALEGAAEAGLQK
jgi:hypothetical protein